MFRPMRRFRQQVSEEACAEVLKEQWRGVLSVLGDGGYPYGVPVDFFYDEEKGEIYFHGAKEGHKIDAIRACDKVSFCVWNEGFIKQGEWALNITSVIAFGKIRIVEDESERTRILRQIGLKYYPDRESAEKVLRDAGHRAICLALKIEHMTGKLVKES